MKASFPRLATVLLVAMAVSSREGRGVDFVAFPESGQTLTFLRDNADYLEFSFGGWGPEWSWMGFKSTVSEADGATRAVCNRRRMEANGGGATVPAAAGSFASTSPPVASPGPSDRGFAADGCSSA